MSILWVVFLIIWLGLTVGSYCLFHRNTGAIFKRYWWPRYTMFSHTVIAFFLWWAGLPWFYLIPLCVVLILLTALTIRSTYFCGDCGKATRHPFFMSRPKQCTHCHR